MAKINTYKCSYCFLDKPTPNNYTIEEWTPYLCKKCRKNNVCMDCKDKFYKDGYYCKPCIEQLRNENCCIDMARQLEMNIFVRIRGRIYAYNTEYGEQMGKAFQYCPFCSNEV